MCLLVRYINKRLSCTEITHIRQYTSTCYLLYYLEVEAKGETDKLSEVEVRRLLNIPQLASYSDKLGAADLLPVWLEETSVSGIEFESGDAVRIKTRGNGPFVCTCHKDF